MRTKAAFLIAAAVMVSVAGAEAQDWTELRGHASGVASSRAVVVKTPLEWSKLWKQHAGGSGTALPKVDFKKETVVAVFAGMKRSGGYSITLEVKTDAKSGTKVVSYKINSPAGGRYGITMITQPFVIRKVAKPESGVLILKRAERPVSRTASAETRESLVQVRKNLSSLSERLQAPGGIFQGF